MIVLCENKMWDLDMGYEIFQHLKRSNPQMRVKLTEHNSSSYKAVKMAEIRKVEDYSIARNLNALGRR